MQPISVIIPVLNEVENLKELLPLLSWADELIVLDSFSNDQTEEVAKQFNVRFLQRKYDGPAFQKNWAIDQAKNEWILILDADERPTPELTEEIKKTMSNNENKISAWWIKRRNFFMGREIKFSGWQKDKVIRLFRKSQCRYKSVQVHEEIETEAKVGQLKNPMLHYTFRDMKHFMDKMERYAQWSAQDHQSKTGKIGLFHLYLKPAFRFFKHYFLQQGFRDGKAGFVISKIMAWSVYRRYCILKKMREE